MRGLLRLGFCCLLGVHFIASAGAQAPAAAPKHQSVTVTATDAERASLTVTQYDGEVHLVPSQHSISVRMKMTVRNDGPLPLRHIALQISSSLAWYSLHVQGQAVSFSAQKIDSDIDHTGKLSEAVVTLPQPLAVGASLPLDVLYSGTVDPSAERLIRIGAPEKVALSSDWDQISPDFTGLRGFGHVVWMPVSTVPVLLGQGAKALDAIGEWKLRESDARVQLHVEVEYHSTAPTIAVLNGEIVEHDATHSSSSDPNILHVASFTLPPQTLGFHSFGLFVASRARVVDNGITILAREEDSANAPAYQQAFKLVRPTVEQWLGTQAKRPIVLVDLPNADNFPYQERNVLFVPLTKADPKALPQMMANIASHAYFISPRPWLTNGVAQFLTTLEIENTAGRDAAVEQLESSRGALALAEPVSPEKNTGQSLIAAHSDIYLRDKAAYVFWMLRELVGDGALARALQNYNSALDLEPSYFQHLTEQAGHKDNEWFFDDWVYRDLGLPDLRIVNMYSRPVLHGNDKNYLVTVEVQNSGSCAAQVPITLQSATASETTHLLVPAGGKSAVRVVMESLPTSVTVNDGTIPEVEASRHQQSVPAAK